MNPIPSAKRNIIVTGGSKGLGHAVVKRLAENGHKVLYTCNKSSAPLNTSLSTPVRCDVQNRHDIERLFDTANNLFDGEIHGVITNAAVSGGYRQFKDMSRDSCKRIIDTNLYGVIACNEIALKQFAQQNSKGHIFNVIGAGADGSATPGHAVYGATKSAIQQFSQSIKKELGANSNVAVHLVSPGMIRTELLLENLPDYVVKMVLPFSETPDVVAEWLVPNVISTIEQDSTHRVFKFMTARRIIDKLCNYFVNKRN